MQFFCSGARERLLCARAKEARKVWSKIIDAIFAGLPYAVVGDPKTASIFAIAEIASVTVGIPIEVLKVLQPTAWAAPPKQAVAGVMSQTPDVYSQPQRDRSAPGLISPIWGAMLDIRSAGIGSV